MEEKKQPVVVKTIIHLTDVKGWKLDEDRPGDFNCGNTYRIGKKVRYADALVPITKFAETDYPPVDVLKYMDYEFKLERMRYESLCDNYFIKHLYFEER